MIIIALKNQIFKIAGLLFYFFLIICMQSINAQTLQNKTEHFPLNGAKNVNPDTYFKLTFNSIPNLHNKGKIRIYDASNNTLVDELDLSIAPGPKNTRTPAPYDKFVYSYMPDSTYTSHKEDLNTAHKYHLNYVGGAKPIDTYHFYPVLIDGNTALIYPHNNHLTYNKTYYIVVDSGVFSFANGQPFQIEKNRWQFQTKKMPPAKDSKKIIVSADGKGDFTTVQGAIDFIPENNSLPISIFIKKGTYNEIINCSNRKGISFIGEDRNGTVIRYANNAVFNFREMSPDPNLNKDIHNIRAVIAIHRSSEITIANLTVQSLGEKPAQAEALLVVGDKMIIDNVAIEGSGDALQATGRVYVNNSNIQGHGDNVLGYGAVYFNNCEFVSYSGPHMWVRNTEKNHGNVLVNCTLKTIGDAETDIARAPDNHGIKYPYTEVVLIDCKVEGLRPSGWGTVTDATENIKYWEYNTTSLETGKAVDISQRHPASKQLTMEKDAELINNYRKPSYVLDGWNPELSAH
ncbi:pectinesterase family protein [Flavobacterium sp. WC2509]|uniref:pectinesterase family protein n=1 Tax=Flavobacterium sp. WC2509 TaxID=3461406 RepID=UPI0040445F90